ncbi:MAG: tRNA (adenosine(37)-N6)-dimethylallyltransferase MiaA [Proteobacteria bacterium]|nr:tRNA (adenosine(37)-N6)-dimethylallyltransferase MiaA [Pseudomonadota bacterium]
MFAPVSVDAVLIAGPTAGGKSAAALALAREIGGAIINTDSMQIYREARILTARPTAEDEAQALHLLYGHVSVNEFYSVGRYCADAARSLDEVRREKRIPIFTGGTGLYFDALTEGLADIPPIPAAIRETARLRREKLGAGAFFEELRARDPETSARLRAGDTQRTLRAFEVLEATGRPLAQWQREKEKPLLAGLKLARFVISPPRDVLHDRINARFEAMLMQGTMEEAARLVDIPAQLPAAKILGRRELLAVRADELSLEEAAAKIQAATRQYAKRQLTWFRNRMADWVWIEDLRLSNILSAMQSHLL